MESKNCKIKDAVATLVENGEKCFYVSFEGGKLCLSKSLCRKQNITPEKGDKLQMTLSNPSANLKELIKIDNISSLLINDKVLF